MRASPPDPETVLPGIIHHGLAPVWPRLRVSRAKSDDPRHTHQVTIQRAGGDSPPPLDRCLLLVNVWAPTDVEANALALDVRAFLVGGGRVSATCSGPSTISVKAESPQRFMTATCVLRWKE